MSHHLERLLQIDECLRSPRKHTQQSMAQFLSVSVRTLRNDFATLRDRYGAPIKNDRSKGWHYTDSSWRLPTIPVTRGGLFALTLGSRMLESYAGAIYREELRETIERLAERFPEKSFSSLQQLAETGVHFRVGGEIQIDPVIWQALIDASGRSQSVSMHYFSPKRREVSERGFDPYLLDIYRASNPYVWGYCHLRKEVRQFRIDRIRQLEILGQTFERREFDLQEKLKGSFQYEVGGKSYDVEILFDAQTAPYITERQWHSTQNIDTHSDGSITLRFTASGLNDMKRWILGYGRGAIAKSPPELVKMLQQETAQMARQNETGEFE